MLLLSPGLALFLYGVSLDPRGRHRRRPPRCSVPTLVGAVLIVGFVPALRCASIHPLIDLRLFKNRNLTVAVIAMIAVRDRVLRRRLLFPRYFLQVRGESHAGAGLLLAPQGIGAMLTMPIAGLLTDKIGPGKIVLVGIALIAVGHGDVHPGRRGHVVRAASSARCS